MAHAIRHPSGSHAARLDRLRGDSDHAELAAQLASTVEYCCAEGDHDLAFAREMLEIEALAWIVLCDRGWPASSRPTPDALLAARAWMAAWSELVSLPVVSGGSADSARHRDIRLTLFLCERTLRPALPAELWRVVGSLNPTGQATLACVLQALAGWLEANAKALTAAERTTHLRERFERLTGDLPALGLTPPDNPLDLRKWRSLAASARELAAA